MRLPDSGFACQIEFNPINITIRKAESTTISTDDAISAVIAVLRHVLFLAFSPMHEHINDAMQIPSATRPSNDSTIHAITARIMPASAKNLNFLLLSAVGAFSAGSAATPVSGS